MIDLDTLETEVRQYAEPNLYYPIDRKVLLAIIEELKIKRESHEVMVEMTNQINRHNDNQHLGQHFYGYPFSSSGLAGEP